MAELDTVEVIARCRCLANKSSWKISKSSLPLDAGICNCDSCRHGTGTLGFTGCTWPLPIPELPNCTKAAFSPRADVYFCKTCGTLMFFHHRTHSWTGLALGALEDPTVYKLSMHLCLADTKDGGMSVWLDNINGTQLKKYATDNLQAEFDETRNNGRNGGDEVLEASCRCGGVQFKITRAIKRSSQVIPKYSAELCVCDSCRLAVGCEIMTWAFIPADNLVHDGKLLPSPPMFGAMKHYASSQGADRYFCAGCGAIIFLISKTNPRLFKVAVGLLHDGSGARAEDWLWWRTETGPANASDGLRRNFLTKDLTKQIMTWKCTIRSC